MHRQYYKPYGEVAWQTGNSRTPVGFTGQRLDSETGLMEFGARYYDPVLSHFISADPTTPDASNPIDYHKYLYTRGNPLRYIDPLGYGPNDHYIFVQGCLDGECNRDSYDDWGEYGEYLRYLYETEGWGVIGYFAGHKVEMPFEVWAKTHVHYVPAGEISDLANPITATNAAQPIRDKIAEINRKYPNATGIHLLGHSAGGGAIAQYLIDAGNGVGYDPKVKSAVMIDAPINAISAARKSFEKLAGMGMHIAVVDTPYDWVSHPEIGATGISEYHSPTYGKSYSQYGYPYPIPSVLNHDLPRPDLRDTYPYNKWHDWTSTHMADEARTFLSKAWQ